MGDHCGGTGGCSGSHVYVVLGMEILSEIDDKEDRILDTATFVTETSRLGCMARVQGDVTVIITDESLDAWAREHPEPRSRRVAM